MKIYQLHFENLNSLAGRWSIDFSDPALVDDGIFAITGPTGSGKTTILDAICLALYGCTPRLNTISQSTNEVMTRQTGYCSAEIEFESSHGRFRCHWSQHRSRKLPDGKLQAAKHEIAEVKGDEEGNEKGDILATKRQDVLHEVERLTGMDFEQFTRSVMLAQGSFAAFLDAKPDQRAPILEQITGTDVYSRISISVHQRFTEENAKLVEQNAVIADFELPSDEEVGTLEKRHEESEKTIAELQEKDRELNRAIQWHEAITRLQGDLLRLKEQSETFGIEKTEQSEMLKRFDAATRAGRLRPLDENLTALIDQQVSETEQLSEYEEKLPELAEQQKQIGQSLRDAELAITRLREDTEQQHEIIKQVRLLDQQITQSDKSRDELKRECDAKRDKQSELKGSIEKRDKHLVSVNGQLDELKKQLDANRNDRQLIESFEAIRQRVERFVDDLRQQLKLQSNLRELEAKRGEFGTTVQVYTDQLETAKEKIGVAREKRAAIGTEISEQLADRDLVDWKKRITDLQDQRRDLEQRISLNEQIVGVDRDIEETKKRLHELDQATVQVSRSLDSQCREQKLQEELVTQLEEKLLLVRRVQDLEQQRAELIDGDACPLCGAIEHPYATNHAPRPDDTRLQLDHAKEKLVATTQQLQDSREKLAGLRSDCQHGNDRFDELTKARSDLASKRGDLHGVELMTAMNDCSSAIESCESIVNAVVELQKESDDLDQKLREEQSAIEDLERQMIRAATESKAICDRVLQSQNDLGDSGTQINATREQLAAELALYDVPDHDSDSFPGRIKRISLQVEQSEFGSFCCFAEQLVEQLQERRDEYAERVTQKGVLKSEASEMQSVNEREEALLGSVNTDLSDMFVKQDRFNQEADRLASERTQLYGNRDPDIEQQRVSNELRESEQRLGDARELDKRTGVQISTVRQSIEHLQQSVQKRRKLIESQQTELSKKIQDAGFDGPDTFRNALLDDEEFQQLEQACERLKQRELELKTLLIDTSNKLQQQSDLAVTEQPIDTLREQHESIASSLTEHQQAIGALTQQVTQWAQLESKHTEQLESIKRQEHEFKRWKLLHQLIGSADGKKFRNFAQGLTFERMVMHANIHLRQMNDRYLLVRDDDEPLELNVIDNYRGGEVRSTKNLSGGEGFIVSLALALGLSSMASRNVQVDSLFLDEGFGTLDESSLQTALDTLSGMHRDGKLIGVISHVPALKQRITSQIRVDKQPGGLSRISGPGCNARK